jgi:ADP-ribosylglycohydrolase
LFVPRAHVLLKRLAAAPDRRGMSRGVGLVGLLVSLALVGALWGLSARQTGPTSAQATRAETQAEQAVAGINFTQAATQLEAFHAESGTYVGATLPASFGVTLVRTDASSYCLQAGVGSAEQHEVGPGGAPASGPC